jgi:protein-tyrosine phosphatase
MFVDIHNHLLPGIDDGAKDHAETLAMARRAVAGGTDTMVATPHRIWQARHEAPASWVREQVAEVQALLEEATIPLMVLPGVELQIVPELADDLRSGLVSPLGHGRWALIEPPFDHIPGDALTHLQSVLNAGFSIVLAHPERCASIQRSLDFAEACAALGIVLQLTTTSLLGRFGPRPQETAELILTHAADWPLVIASDMHDLQDRNPGMMLPARDAAAKIVGPAAAQDMVDARPRAIVHGSPLPPL